MQRKSSSSIDNLGSIRLPAKVVSAINRLPQIPTEGDYSANRELYLLKMIVAIVDSKEKHVTGKLISKAANAVGIAPYADYRVRVRATRNFFQTGLIDRRRNSLLDPVSHRTGISGTVRQFPYYPKKALTIKESKDLLREWLFTPIRTRDFLKEHELCWKQFYGMLRDLSVSGRIHGYRLRDGEWSEGYEVIFDYSKYEKVSMKKISHLTKYQPRVVSKWLAKHPEMGTTELLQYQRTVNVLRKYL
jgi:hypothetical protein